MLTVASEEAGPSVRVFYLCIPALSEEDNGPLSGVEERGTRPWRANLSLRYGVPRNDGD